MSVMQRIAAIALALTLSFGTASAALAQDATPDATPETAGASASGAPQVGDAVPIYDSESLEEIATITVESVTDPFEDYAEFYEPEAGTRYVGVEYTVENLVENDSLDLSTYDLALGTDQGFLLPPSFASIAEDSDVTELEDGEVLGGESVTGTVVYELPEETAIGGLFYTAYGFYTLLADVSGTSSPAVGDEVTVFNTDGDEYAAVTVTGYEDPFEGYGEFSAPDRGDRVIAVTVSVENLVENDGIDLSQYDFTVQTSEGFLVSSSFVEPAEDSDVTALEDTRLGGGDSGEGTIFFVLPEETEVTGIIFQPDSGIVVNVGNPQA